MACLESAIFSIDLDDDHIDDVIYQEGGAAQRAPSRRKRASDLQNTKSKPQRNHAWPPPPTTIKENERVAKNMAKLKPKQKVRTSVFKRKLNGNNKINSKSDSPASTLPSPAPTPTPKPASTPTPTPTPASAAASKPASTTSTSAEPKPAQTPEPTSAAAAAAQTPQKPPPPGLSQELKHANKNNWEKTLSENDKNSRALDEISGAKETKHNETLLTPPTNNLSVEQEDPLEIAALELFKGQFLYYKEIEKLLGYINNLYNDHDGTKIKVMLHRRDFKGDVTKITMKNEKNKNILINAKNLLNSILSNAKCHLYDEEKDALDDRIPLIPDDKKPGKFIRHSSSKFHVVATPTERDKNQNKAERDFIKDFLEGNNKFAIGFLSNILSKENLEDHRKYTMIYETFFSKLDIKPKHNPSYFDGVHPVALETYKTLKKTFGLKDEEGKTIDYIIETSLGEDKFDIFHFTNLVITPVQRQLRYGDLFRNILERYIKKKKKGEKLSDDEKELLLKPDLKLKPEEKEEKQKLQSHFNEDTFFKFLSEYHNSFYKFSMKSNEYQFVETKPVFDTFCNDNKSYFETINIPPFPFKYETEKNMNELEELPKEFLRMIFNSISNLKNISLSPNGDIVKCRSNNKQIVIVTELKEQLQEQSKNNNLDFSSFIGATKHIEETECLDILMKLIMFEQASTYYMTKCISSKHNNFLFHNTQRKSLTGFWEKDKHFFIDNYSGSLVNNSLVGGSASEEEKADYPDKIGNYEEHSIVYKLFEVVHNQFEELFGHSTEIENIKEMFNFKKINDTVEQFVKDTIEKKQNLLSNLLQISVNSVNHLKKKQEEIKAEEEQAEKEKETLLSNVLEISVNMKQKRDIKLLGSLAGLLAKAFTERHHKGEIGEMEKYQKKCLQKFIKQYNRKKLNYDKLYDYLNNPTILTTLLENIKPVI